MPDTIEARRQAGQDAARRPCSSALSCTVNVQVGPQEVTAGAQTTTTPPRRTHQWETEPCHNNPWMFNGLKPQPPEEAKTCFMDASAATAALSFSRAAVPREQRGAGAAGHCPAAPVKPEGCAWTKEKMG